MDERPPHPGYILRRRLGFGLNINVTRTAKFLGIPRKALSDILNERSGLSADIAVRLDFANLGDARYWLAINLDYNLWKARLREAAKAGDAKAQFTLDQITVSLRHKPRQLSTANRQPDRGLPHLS